MLRALRRSEGDHVGLVAAGGWREDADYLAPVRTDADRPAEQPECVVHASELDRGAMPQHDDRRATQLLAPGEEAPSRELQSGEVDEARRGERELHGRARAEELRVGA